MKLYKGFLLGIGFLLVLFSACSTYVTRPEFNRVRQGMSRAEVEKVLDGKSPQERRVESGGREIWLLDVAIPWTHNFEGKQIIFEKDRVVSLGPSAERQKRIDDARRRRAEARRAANLAEQRRIERQQLIALEADRLATRRAEARAVESQNRYGVVVRPGYSSTPRPVQNYRFDFYGFLQRIRSKKFSDEKLEVVQDAVRSTYFSSSQVIMLIKEFKHDQDKMKALQIVAGRISDPGNRYKIVDSFSFSSDKNEARRILGL